MAEVKDPKIKLFGKTIELPEISAAEAAEIVEAAQCCDAAIGEDGSKQDPPCSSTSAVEDGNFNGDAEDNDSQKSQCSPKQDHAEEKDESHLLISDKLKDSNETSPVVENSKALSADSDAGPNQSKTDEDQSETGNSDEKTLKKPDKILPCPRCNSMDTKFCYFNNYNVNQPRHFCKNCQRYWTAGGTMRNVPVGAGRRKNKSATAQFRHVSIPEALANGAHHHHHPVVNPDGKLLAFSTDVPLCESMVSVLNIADKTIRNVSTNGFCKPMELGLSVSHGSKDNGDEHSNGSSNNTTSSNGETRLSEQLPNCPPYPLQMPFYPGAPWPYQWPNFAPASFPLPFYPTPPPYWGCTIPGGWNIPWVIPPIPTATQSQGHPSTGPNSPTLGKHSREDNVIKPTSTEEETHKESDPEKCLWVPKTLRIDDPGEAAKSSIWATLGIKNERVDSVSCGGGGGSLFKAFQSQSKGGEKNQVKEAATVLQANPAAFSRSVNFHESS